jgi:hypothetical protein
MNSYSEVDMVDIDFDAGLFASVETWREGKITFFVNVPRYSTAEAVELPREFQKDLFFAEDVMPMRITFWYKNYRQHTAVIERVDENTVSVDGWFAKTVGEALIEMNIPFLSGWLKETQE